MRGCERNDIHCRYTPLPRYAGVIAERWGTVERWAETAELEMD